MFLDEKYLGKIIDFPVFGGDPSNNIENVFRCLVGIKNIFLLWLVNLFIYLVFNF